MTIAASNRSPVPSARVLLLLLLLGGAALLVGRLDFLSFSVDEFVNNQIERGTWNEIIDTLQKGDELHPPLTHFVMSLWIQIVGETEFPVRFLWALAGVLNLALIYRLATLLFDRLIGFGAALLTLTTPTFLLYTRFQKYYSVTITLCLLLLLAGIYLWQRPVAGRAMWYGVVLVALLYTDYLGPLLLVLGQDITLLLWGRSKARLKWFLGAQAVVALLYLPWLIVLAVQAQTLQGSLTADLGASWLGFALRLAYWPYAVGVGETVLPWHAAAVAGVLALGITVIAGVFTMSRRNRQQAGFRSGPFMLIVLTVALLGSAWLTNFVFASVSFIAFPNHVLFLLPLFMIVVAVGIRAMPHRLLSITLLVLLLLPRVIGIYNYFIVRDYHNPIYAVPIREVTARLLEVSRPQDVVISASDVGFDYYYHLLRPYHEKRKEFASLLLGEPAEIGCYLSVRHTPRVWLLRFGRDRTGQVEKETEMAAWLEQAGYRVTETKGYTEQDFIYRRVKERLFGRDVYRYKLVVELYQRQQ